MVVIFLGPPGSGKGSQAAIIANELKSVVHVSTGEMLRQEIAKATPIGLQVKKIVESGEYPSESIVVDLVSKLLKDLSDKTVIFDGFPRTINQVLAFDQLLGVENHKVDLVIDFQIKDEMIVDRLSGRYTCSQCNAVYHDKFKRPQVENICDVCGGTEFSKRKDDSVDVIQRRLDVYHEQTKPIGTYYEKQGVLKTIDASLPIEEVRSQIDDLFERIGIGS